MEDSKGQHHFTKEASRDHGYNEQYTGNLNYDRDNQGGRNWQCEDANQHENAQHYNGNQC